MTNKEFKSNLKNHYRGISYYPSMRKWRAAIREGSQIRHIKHFNKLIDAIDFYDMMAIQIYGEETITNKKLIEAGVVNKPTNEFDYKGDIEPDIIDSLEGEIWKDVLEYEGFYMASNIGRVRSLNREVLSKKAGYTTLQVKGKILSPKIDKDGYLSVILCNDSGHKHLRVHQIIGKTFISNPDNLPEIHHKNHTVNDNRTENLMWVTTQQNMFYKHLNHKENVDSITINKHTLSKSSRHAVKLNPEKVKQIKEMYSTGQYTQKYIGNLFGVSTNYISSIVLGKNWNFVT